ncbi:MAG: hypothetical protein ACU0DT_11935 [Albimonas sp.]|uniref:hypothetical protein n=1 Tax=Albimonas sp. TaxID=1872425 RepID=UPI004055B494
MGYEVPKTSTTTSADGILTQANAVDLLSHWQETLESELGFSLDSLFNVQLFDLEERIDISIGKHGFSLDVVPLGTNYLSYKIQVKDAATNAWVDVTNARFATSGEVDDLNYIELFGRNAPTDGKDYRITYSGYYTADAAGPQTFRYTSEANVEVRIDGERVTPATPTKIGGFTADLAQGTQAIEIVVHHKGLAPAEAGGPVRTAPHLVVDRLVDGKAVDIMETVAVDHEAEFRVTAAVSWVPDGSAPLPVSKTFSFVASDLSEIHDKLVALARAEGADHSREFHAVVTATGDAEIDAAGKYTFKAQADGWAKTLSVDGVQKASGAAGRGFDATIDLAAGDRAFKVDLKFDGAWSQFAAQSPDLTWKGAATHSHAVSLLQGASAVSDGLVEVLNDGLELIGQELAAGGDLFDLLMFGASPLKVAPMLDFSLGLDAEFGWDVELPSLGRTTTAVPVSFSLVSDAEAEFGGMLTARVADLTFGAPTTRSHMVELGAIDVTSNFGLPQTSLSDLGIHLGTRSVAPHAIEAVFGEGSALAKLNTALEGLLNLELKLDASITLEDALSMAATAAGAAGVAYDPAKSLDLSSFLKGLYETPGSVQATFEELEGHVQAGEWKEAFELFIRIGGMAPDEAEGTPEEKPKKGDEPDPSKFQMVTDKGKIFTAASDEMLGLARDAALKTGDGKSMLTYVDDALGKVRVSVDQVNKVIEATGIDEVLSNIAKLFNEGVSLVPGITFKGDLGIGRTFVGHGWTSVAEAVDDAGVAVATVGERYLYDPEHPKQIVTTSSVKLLSAEVDLRETLLDGISSAFDNPLLQEAEANPYVEIARIAAALAPILIEKLEEGGSADLEVDLGPLIHEAVVVFDGMVKSLTGVLNEVIKILPVHVDPLDAAFSLTDLLKLAEEDPDNFEAHAREALAPVKLLLEDIAGAVNAAIRTVASEIDVLLSSAQTLHAFAEEAKDSVVGAINKLVDVVDHISQRIYQEHVDLGIHDFKVGETVLKALVPVIEHGFGLEFYWNDGYPRLHSDRGVLHEIRAGLEEAPGALDSAIHSLRGFIRSLDLDLDGPIDALVDALASFVPAVLQPMHARADLDLDLFELMASAELDFEQVTTFNPDAVMVEYRYGDAVQTVAYGESVAFKVPNKRAAEKITASVIYDGAYDYKYVVRPDFKIADLEVLAISLATTFTHGTPPAVPQDPTRLDYALIKAVAGEADGDIIQLAQDGSVLSVNTTALHDKLMELFDEAVAAPLRELLGSERGALPLGSIVFDTKALAHIPGFESLRPHDGENGHAFTPVTATATVEVSKSKAIVADKDGGKLKGTKKSDEMRGQGGDDKLLGAGGNDTLLGGAGEDELNGGGGKDILDGGAGDDRLIGGGGKDVLYGDEGADRLDGGGGADRLIVDAGFAEARGGGGKDRIEFDGAREGMLIDLGSGSSALADALGGAKIHGGSMYVELSTKGLAWSNAVASAIGAGGVLLQIDSLEENAYIAAQFAPTVAAPIWIGATDLVENGVYRDLSGRPFGVDFANWLPGEPNDAGQPEPYVAMLTGGGWNDATLRPSATTRSIAELDLATAELATLAPGAPVSSISTVENVVGTQFGDWIFGTGAANRLDGRDGDDLLRGEGGRDALFGGAGDDTLAGGEGDDLLEGGAGADRFAFSGAFGTDAIADFSGAAGDGDVIDLRPVDAAIPGGILFADLLFTRQGDDLRIEIDVNRDGVADVYDLDGDEVDDPVAILLAGTVRADLVEADFIL